MAVDTFRDMLRGLNREAKELQSEFLRLKEDAADAKKRWEAKVTEIQQAIDEDYPLFDRGDDSPSDGGNDGGGGGGGGGDDGPAAPPPSGDGEPIDVEFRPAQPALPAPAFRHDILLAESEAWRVVPLQDLDAHGLSDKLIANLADAGLKTIGDLANFSNAGKRLTDIDGIGEARADEIETAMEGFWAEWKRAQAKPKSGGDLVTSRPGTWANDEISGGEDKPKKPRKKKTA